MEKSTSTARSPESWTEYLRSVDTPTLSNAIELLKLRPSHEGFTPLQIRAFFPELGRMCGYAVTAQVETMTKSGESNLDTTVELYRAVGESTKPAVVVLQEVGGHPDYATHCGEVMATTFQRLGATGLVSDCAVRDIPEVRRLGFHFFARGAVASHGHFRIVRVGLPVQIHGLVIHPQDMIHGDENGLILVPKGGLERLPGVVDSVREAEGKMLEFLRGPQFSVDGLRKQIEEAREAMRKGAWLPS
ncbi:MAG: RraA family protein [Terriglobia bacterium]